MSAAEYRARVAEAIAGGRAARGPLRGAPDGQPLVRAVLSLADGSLRSESVELRDGLAPSIVDLAPAAEWAEREAHDLHGAGFDGHEPLRPLAEHTPELASWTVPVAGGDAYQVAVGPVHAGVIESGHFRFHVVGDRILHLDVRLFYKHRGLELASAGVPLDEGIAYAARACGACAVTNRLAYALAAERLRGLHTAPEVARARTLLLELERLWNHLNDIAAICAGVSLAAGNQRFAALCEEARRLNAAIAGHRLLFGSVHVGGSHLAIDDELRRAARSPPSRACARRRRRAGASSCSTPPSRTAWSAWRLMGGDDARAWGAVGPAARASGDAEDARLHCGGDLAYEGFAAALADRPEGDVRARLEQRELELAQTFALLDGLLEQPLAAAACASGGAQRTTALARVESPRGATLCALERSGDRVGRLHLRTGSYANWPALARVVPGNLMPDFPLINKSFELCYACADR